MGGSNVASAHAIIVSAQPAPDAVVAGPDLAIVFTFNVRIDNARSTLTLTRPDGTTSGIALIPDASPAVLAGHLANLTSGAYSIRWQVLATDGHITRGDVPFTIAP
jgi:methionine-rich copper-binding protein CopC